MLGLKSMKVNTVNKNKTKETIMSEFQPFQRVLVRDDEDDKWKAALYSHFEEGKPYGHICVGNLYIYI